MLHVVIRCLLAAVLAAAAGAKAAPPQESRVALWGLLGRPLPRFAPWLLVVVELGLATGVSAGSDAAAFAAAVLMMAGAALLGRALADGRDGAPCGCFGARSRVSRLAVLRALALSFA